MIARRLLTLLAVLAAPAAAARPLALDLGLPGFSLFGQVEAPLPPPPVILPPGPALEPSLSPSPPAAQAPPPAQDVLRLKDGRTLQGKILYPVQNGLLFRDSVSQETYVVQFPDIVDVQHAQAAPVAGGSFAPDRRLFLEAQIRDVQARYDALSLWPSIEELIGGAVGIAGAVLIVAFLGPAFGGDVISDVFAAIVGIPGLVSLIVGVVGIASVVKREHVLKDQLEHLKSQLAATRADVLPAPITAPAIAFRF